MNEIFLIQTDTTAGFCAKDFRALNALKGRALEKPCILTLPSLAEFSKRARCPAKFKNTLRRAEKTSFIIGSQSFRVVRQPGVYHDFLERFGAMYSSSANLTGKDFDEPLAIKMATTVVYSPGGFRSCAPSKLIKLYKTRYKRIR